MSGPVYTKKWKVSIFVRPESLRFVKLFLGSSSLLVNST